MNIFSSLEIKDKIFRNRIVVPPMAQGLATKEGAPTKENISHYKKISRDVGLTIVEHSFISEAGKYSSNQLGIHRDEFVGDLKKINEAIKSNNSLSCIQINHSGDRKTDKITENISEESVQEVNSVHEHQLGEIKKDFVRAAERAERAGFDAVEIHGAHGFLLNSFLSPISNDRKDEYGGTFQNRIRFPLEVVNETNDALNDSLLFYRLGATDNHPDGLKKREAIQAAMKLEATGVDVIDVSGGLCGSRPKQLEGKQGYFVPIASTIKNEVSVPVIGVGGIKDPEIANKFIEENKLDLVAIGREKLRNPDWVKDARKELK